MNVYLGVLKVHVPDTFPVSKDAADWQLLQKAERSHLINVTLPLITITTPSHATIDVRLLLLAWCFFQVQKSKMDDNVLPQSTVCAKIMELLGQNKVDHRQRKVAIVSQDCFYKVLTPEQKAKALKGQYNFDHPGNLHWQTWSFLLHQCHWFMTTQIIRYLQNYFVKFAKIRGKNMTWICTLPTYWISEAFDNELMYKTLKDIVEGRVVDVPTYDFVTHSR